MQDVQDGVQDRQRVRPELNPALSAPKLLTAEEVGRILGIDRSTVYRLAESGKMPATKIGRQWRFPAEQFDWLVEGSGAGFDPVSHQVLEEAARAALPYVELGAEILNVMMVITDMEGRPLADVVNPCAWFSYHSGEPGLLDTCLADWQQQAADLDFAIRFHTGPLGFDCARTFVRVGPRLVAMLIAGGVAARDDDRRELYQLDAAGRARVLESLPKIAARLSAVTAETVGMAGTGSTAGAAGSRTGRDSTSDLDTRRAS